MSIKEQTNGRITSHELFSKLLLGLLSLAAGLLALAFNNWAGEVRDGKALLQSLITDYKIEAAKEREQVRQECRVMVSNVTRRLEAHLQFSTERVQDYEARLRVLESHDEERNR